MNVTSRPAHPDDVPPMVEHLREVNLKEIAATGISDPYASVMHSVTHSTHAWSYWNDGMPLAMGGIGPAGSLAGGMGIPWLVGTIFLDRWPMAVLRYTKRNFEAMKVVYPDMFNFTHSDDKVTMAWLKWLGFKIHPARPLGPHNEPFHLFTYGAPHVHWA